MNNDDITIDKKMLEGFLKEIARGGIKQDGKVISDVEMLVADKPTSCNNNSFNGLNFSNEQLVKVCAEYKKILEKYEDKLDDVFRNRAAYNKRLDEIEGVFDSLSSTQEEIRNLSARDISNLSSPELKHLKKLYKDLNKYNVDYINRQKEIIFYVHAEKRGIETAFSDEIKYRSLINKDTRNSCEKKLIEKYEYKHNAPIFGVSSGNEFLNILQNLQNKIVNLNSGKLTNFTKNMFDKSTGKFTAKQDGIFSKIRNFAEKHFNSEETLGKLNKKVQNLRNDILVNDIIMNKIKKIYKIECDHISQNEKRLSYNDVVNIVNAIVTCLPEQYSSDICTKVEKKIKVYLAEIKKNIEKNGYTMLEALNAALFSDENSYNAQQNLLSEYKKASTKLFRRIELNQFKKENNGIDLSHTTEEDNSYDVRDIPNPIGKKTSIDEYEEPVITNENNEEVLNIQDEEQNNEYLDSDLERTPNFSNHDLNNMSGKDAKIPETEPVTELDIKTELSTETSNTSTNENNQNEPASETENKENRDNDFSDNENEEEVHENTEIQNGEPYFTTEDLSPVFDSYIATLEVKKDDFEKRKNDLLKRFSDFNEMYIEFIIGKKIDSGLDLTLEENQKYNLVEMPIYKEMMEELKEIDKKINCIKNEIDEAKDKFELVKPSISKETAKREIQLYEDFIAEDFIANDGVLKAVRDELKKKKDELDKTNVNGGFKYCELLENMFKNSEILSEDEINNLKKEIWENYADFTNSVNEESYKPRTK